MAFRAHDKWQDTGGVRDEVKSFNVYQYMSLREQSQMGGR